MIIPKAIQIFLLTAVAAAQEDTAESSRQVYWPLPYNVTGFAQRGTWGGIHVHDPSLAYGPDGNIYSFSTHGGPSVSRSRNLEGPWEHLGAALPGARSSIDHPGAGDMWAPDVSSYDGVFYLFYSISKFGSQDSAIGLATSSSNSLGPGEWADKGAVLRSGSGREWPFNITNAIDPNLFVDPATGEPWLTYGSFWKGLWQVRLGWDASRIDETVVPMQLAYEPSGDHPIEAPFLDENDGWYYLWFSHGKCCGFDRDRPAPGTELVSTCKRIALPAC
jgi:arabinan endo-1,5-alpha-L-arabinosidase